MLINTYIDIHTLINIHTYEEGIMKEKNECVYFECETVCSVDTLLVGYYNYWPKCTVSNLI